MDLSIGKLRFLLIEDEGMVSLLIEDMLTEMGHEVTAAVSRMNEALRVAKTGHFDLAIVDVNLDGQPSYPVAEILRERGIPFAFATGYGTKGLDPKFTDVPVLAKPFTMSDVELLLHRMTLREGSPLV